MLEDQTVFTSGRETKTKWKGGKRKSFRNVGMFCFSWLCSCDDFTSCERMTHVLSYLYIILWSKFILAKDILLGSFGPTHTHVSVSLLLRSPRYQPGTRCRGQEEAPTRKPDFLDCLSQWGVLSFGAYNPGKAKCSGCPAVKSWADVSTPSTDFSPP